MDDEFVFAELRELREADEVGITNGEIDALRQRAERAEAALRTMTEQKEFFRVCWEEAEAALAAMSLDALRGEDVGNALASANAAIARAERAEAALAAVPWQALLNISHALAASDAASDPDEAALLAFLNEYAPWVPA